MAQRKKKKLPRQRSYVAERMIIDRRKGGPMKDKRDRTRGEEEREAVRDDGN